MIYFLRLRIHHLIVFWYVLTKTLLKNWYIVLQVCNLVIWGKEVESTFTTLYQLVVRSNVLFALSLEYVSFNVLPKVPCKNCENVILHIECYNLDHSCFWSVSECIKVCVFWEIYTRLLEFSFNSYKGWIVGISEKLGVLYEITTLNYDKIIKYLSYRRWIIPAFNILDLVSLSVLNMRISLFTRQSDLSSFLNFFLSN